MLAPVVVNPDTVSKKASMKEGISPEITKGNAPKIDIKSQENATITKPSFANIMLSFVLPINIRRKANKRVAPMEIAKLQREDVSI